jgi:hypothetical protein
MPSGMHWCLAPQPRKESQHLSGTIKIIYSRYKQFKLNNFMKFLISFLVDLSRIRKNSSASSYLFTAEKTADPTSSAFYLLNNQVFVS